MGSIALSKLACVLALFPLVSACATEITAQDLAVNERVHTGAPFGSVAITAEGIHEHRYYPLPNERLHEALTRSVEQAGLFTNAADPNAADYSLEVKIIDLPDPSGGMTMTVQALIGWTLRHGKDTAPLLESVVESKATKTFADATLGPTRGTMAIVGAVQANIREGLARMARVLEPHP